MLTINVICVGKLKESFFKEAIDEYSKRLSRYCNLEITELPDEKIPNNPNKKQIEQVKEKECNNILSHVKKDSYIISLDLTGKQLSSEELSSKLDNLSLTTSHITFIIGGSLGLTQEVLSKSDTILSFSKMTFPHQLARVMLCEQIYRAFQINSNGKYHK